MPPLWPQILLQIVLLALHAFFSAAECSVGALNENTLRREAEEGDKKARKLLTLLDTPERFLSGTRVAITLTVFLSAAFAVDHFAGRITDWAVARCGLEGSAEGAVGTLSAVLLVLVLGLVTLLLGEMVPKRVAGQKAEAVAKLCCGPVGVLARLLRPLSWGLGVCADAVARLFGVDPSAKSGEVSEEEIRMMVDIGEEKGAIETDEKEMIENIFEFNNRTAEDVMIHRTDVVMLWTGDSDEEIIHTIEETGLSRYPVYEEDADDIVGILNSRDYFLNARRKNPKPLRQLLREAYFVPESVRADTLFRDMQERKVHLAVVVDEYGGTSGIVTMEDLLEEIVGNIYDEFDPQDEQEIIQLGENLWKVAGSAELEELAETLGIELPEDGEYDTLGGLILAQLPVIPEDGSHIELDEWGLHIKVTEYAERRVEWALVSRLEASPADQLPQERE